MRRVALLAALLPLAARAQPPEPRPRDGSDDDPAIGRKLQELLRAHGAEVHGCYAAALAEQPTVAGELLIQLFVEQGGAICRVELLKDQTGSKPLGECLLSSMRRWTAPQLAGSGTRQFVFPLVFRPDGEPTGTGAGPAEANAAPPGAPAPRPPAYVVPLARGVPGPLGKGKVEARVLLDQVSVGPTQASLTYLALQPAARLALHAHPGSLELLYVVKGMARVRDGGGTVPVASAGDVIVAPAGLPHGIESAPLAPLSLLQLFVPPGPEHAYRDATDRGGTNTVTKGGATGPAAHGGRAPGVTVVSGTTAPTYPILGGKGQAALYLDGLPLGASLQRFEAAAGARVPAHAHDRSDELLYVLGGRGALTIDGKVLPVGEGDAIHIPMGVSHALDVTEKMTALQCYAPGGPEQRFKSSPPAPRPAPHEPQVKPERTPSGR